MAGIWGVKNPLTLQERKIIKKGLKENLTYLDISHILGRAKSTVIRECKRLGDISKYSAEKAQKHFETKQKNKGVLISQSLRERNSKKLGVYNAESH